MLLQCTNDYANTQPRTANRACLATQYVTHFPKEEKYVSILKRPEDPAAAQQVAAEVARLRALVHARAQDAALVADVDEGRSLAHPSAAFQASRPPDAGCTAAADRILAHPG